MSTADSSATHLIWPAERFYWAVLDATIIPRSLMRREHSEIQLGYLFERDLPGPIDGLHAVYLPLGHDRYLACALEHQTLEQDIPRDVISLTPDRVPSELADTRELGDEPINLLTGRHEPAAVRVERQRINQLVIASMVLLTLIILAGVAWRSRTMAGEIEGMKQQRAGIYRQLIDPSTADPSAQPPSLRIVAELRQLRQTRTIAHEQDEQESECAHALEALLARWPAGHQVRTESISVTSSSMTLVVQLPSASDAQAFVGDFSVPDGWQARQPQISTVQDGVRLTMRLGLGPVGQGREIAQVPPSGANP